MQNFFSLLGKFFQGLALFLQIVNNIIWIIIGGTILFGIFFIFAIGGPAKIVNQIVPPQLQQLIQSQGNSNQSNTN